MLSNSTRSTHEEHSGKASTARGKMFVLQAKVMAELRAVLNPEQLEFSKKRKAQGIRRMRHRLDTWLEDKAE